MNSLYVDYQILANEVRVYDERIDSISNNNPAVKNNFRGTQILFSNLLYRPKILLIGINPGSGYFNRLNKNVQIYEPLEKLEYLVHDYTLQKETVKVFSHPILKEIFETQTLKTNVFYWATDSTNNLWGLVRGLCKEQIFDPETQAMRWTKKLVDMINPELIVCEGNTALQKTVLALSGKKINISDSTVQTIQTENYKIIGYKRNYSNIVDKQKLEETLLSDC